MAVSTPFTNGIACSNLGVSGLAAALNQPFLVIVYTPRAL